MMLRHFVCFALLFALHGCGKGTSEYDAAVRDLDDPTRQQDALWVIATRWPETYRTAMFDAAPGIGPAPQRPGDAVLREKLLRLLSSSDGTVVSRAANVLVYLRAPGHDRRLLDCAANSRASYTCTVALRLVADPQALEAMADHLNDVSACPKSSLRCGVHAFSLTLGDLGVRGVPYLERAAANGSRSAAEIAISELRELVDRDPLDVHKALPLTSELRAAVIGALQRIAKHPEWQRRWGVAYALGYADPPEVKALESLRTDPSVFVRDVASAFIDGVSLGEPPTWQRLGDRGPWLESVMAASAANRCWPAVATRELLQSAAGVEKLWAHVTSGLAHASPCCRAAAVAVRGSFVTRFHAELSKLVDDSDEQVRSITKVILDGGDATQQSLPCRAKSN